MDDLISRQTAIDAIRIDNLHEGIVAALQSVLRDLPSAQMEVIGCKDCKYRPTIEKEDGSFLLDGTSLVFPEGKCPCYCADDDYYSWMPDDDFYCKYWEMDEK